jgi:glycosyltransferase involved in cell wall biosynthesis
LEKRKSIIFTVSNDLSYDQRMQRHSKILVNAGFDVLLVGRKKTKSIPIKLEIYKQKRLNCWFQTGKLFYLEFNLRLFIFLLFAKADIYVAIDLDTLIPNTLAAKFKGKKLVFDSHEYFTEVPELIGRNFSKKIWEYVAKTFIPKVDKAYTVGPKLAELFENLYHKPFACILNVGLYEKQIRFEPNEVDPIIFYQGALNEGRGIEQLISAMKSLDAKLWIAGEGDLSEFLRAFTNENNLSEKVKFLGFVEPSELKKLTNQAWLGCNILEPKGLSYQYSLANKFFDYMHSGVPQICANFLEYEAINRKFEIAVLSDCETQNLVQKITNLLVDKGLYQRLKENCLKASEVYNLQLESKKLIDIYKEL